MAKVTLRTKAGKSFKVDAEVIGSFLFFQDGKLWNVSHLPTGYKLFLTKSEADCRAAIAALSKGLDWDWSDDPSKHQKHHKRAKQVFKKFGA